MKKIYFILIPAFIISCKNKIDKFSTDNNYLSTQSYFASHKSHTTSTFEDGTYCATLCYYNSGTELNIACSVMVELLNNQLTHISKSDCESFDGSNVTAKQISQAGTITFKTDKGIEYIVILKEKTPLGKRKFNCDICGDYTQ